MSMANIVYFVENNISLLGMFLLCNIRYLNYSLHQYKLCIDLSLVLSIFHKFHDI